MRVATPRAVHGALHGAVIGGVAVVLHGYVRTTMGVDVLVEDDVRVVERALDEAGYRRDRDASR